MNPYDLKQRLITTGQVLADAYNRLDNTRFKTVPPQGGWPAAGVVGHLHMSETGILRVLAGPGAPVERDPYSKLELLGNGLGQTGKKLVAPANLEPDLNRVELAGAADRLMARRHQMVALLDTLPLDEECMLYAHPYFGMLTRPEWIYFVTVHGDRHLRQLEGIVGPVG